MSKYGYGVTEADMKKINHMMKGGFIGGGIADGRAWSVWEDTFSVQILVQVSKDSNLMAMVHCIYKED